MKLIFTRNFFIIFTCILITFITLFLIENHYTFTQKNIEICTSEYPLNATLVTSNKSTDSKGVILFVHGDGALTASASGAYKPVWQTMINQGYDVISWNKPGVDGSPGNWLDQTMDDRACEVVNVIDWVRLQDAYKNKKIGIWGSSQAGWVVPKVVGKTNVDFVILSAPAINWLRQSEYHLVKSSELQNKDRLHIEKSLKQFRDDTHLLEINEPYEVYLNSSAHYDGEDPMSQARYTFVQLNYLSDCSQDIKNFNSPILLILGGQDINVNTYETRQVYESTLSEDILTVEWIDYTNHAMLRPQYINNELLLFIAYSFSPKRVICNDYLSAIKNFLNQ